METMQPDTILYAEKEVTLPSGYVDLEGALHKQVNIREMSGIEEDLLLNEELAQKGLNTNRILSNLCTLVGKPGVKFVDELTMVDQFYLLVQIRILTYGNDYNFELNCNNRECKSISNISLKLDSLKFEGSSSADKMVQKLELPKSGLTVTFKKNQGKDNPALKQLSSTKGTDKITNLLKYRVVKIEKDGQEVNSSIIGRLAAMDRKFLRDAMNKAEGKAETMLKPNCHKCGQEHKMQLPINENFFCLSESED